MVDSKVRTLLAVVQAGSFTKAAEELHLTQPAVSLAVKELEYFTKNSRRISSVYFFDNKDILVLWMKVCFAQYVSKRPRRKLITYLPIIVHARQNLPHEI